MQRKILYTTLGITCVIAAGLALAVRTEVGALLYGRWILGADAVKAQVDGGFQTTRPPNAPPIVIKTVDGVEGPYLDFSTNGPVTP